MDIYIGNVGERTASAPSGTRADDGGLFRSELADALGSHSESSEGLPDYFGGYSDAFVVVSPKLEEKLSNDPEYSEQLSQKLNALLKSQGESLKNSIVIVNRDGEISQYCTRPEREERHPTAEELKEVAKARARRKARLDAYFHLLERVSIKRKLIEQENAKYLRNKKYRLSVSGLDIAARARQITAPPMDPDYFF